jgi:hypothetical protein
MSRKSFFLGLGIIVFLAGSVSSVLALMVRHEPAVYVQKAPPLGEERKKQSDQFLAECFGLANQMQDKREWHGQFSEEQINSFFEDYFLNSESGKGTLPEGISEPRIGIEPDMIRLAFRYGTERWNTVISIDVRVWLAAREPNVVVLELQALRAGSLPISAQSLLDRIAETARAHNVELTWYRHNGNPVALIRFQPYQSRPTFHLTRLELQQGKIIIGGRSTDALPVSLPPATVTASRDPVD